MQGLNFNNSQTVKVKSMPHCLTFDNILGITTIVDKYFITSYHDLNQISYPNIYDYIKQTIKENLNIDIEIEDQFEIESLDENKINLNIRQFIKPNQHSVSSCTDISVFQAFFKTIDKIRNLGVQKINDVQEIHFDKICISTKRLSMIAPITHSNGSLSKQYIIEVYDDNTIKIGFGFKEVLETLNLTDIYNELETNLQNLYTYKASNMSFYPLPFILKGHEKLQIEEIYRKAIGAVVNNYLTELPNNIYTEILYKSNILSKEEFATPKYIIDKFDLSFIDLMKLQGIISEDDKVENLIEKIKFGRVNRETIGKNLPLKLFDETLYNIEISNYQRVFGVLENKFLSCQNEKYEIWKYMIYYHINNDYFYNFLRMNHQAGLIYTCPIKGALSGETDIIRRSYKPRKQLR